MVPDMKSELHHTVHFDNVHTPLEENLCALILCLLQLSFGECRKIGKIK